MAGECGIVDVLDSKSLMKKGFNAVKHLLGSHRNGWGGRHRRGEGCEGLGGD